MIRFLGSLMQSLRPLIVMGIALGFVAVFITHGSAGLWILLKVVGTGIILNFAIWWAARALWRRYHPIPDKITPEAR